MLLFFSISRSRGGGGGGGGRGGKWGLGVWALLELTDA